MASTKTIAKGKEADQESAQAQSEREILDNLAALGGSAFRDDAILFEGDKMVLPSSMTLRQAIKFLNKKLEEDEEPTDFARVFRFRPWDGAWCAWCALKRVFGSVAHTGTTSTFFGIPFKNPPMLITINVAPGKTEQIPWGAFEIPMLPDVTFELGQTRDAEYGLLFRMTANGPKKWRHHIEGVFKVVEDELATNSMYRGKAIDGRQEPDFLDLSGVDPNRVVYSAQVRADLSANVWSPLRNTERERKLGLPLKRSILLEGPFGTGKTLTAYVTAQIAVENGWTFLMARPGRDDLEFVMQTARLYQPAVVFFEDMDKVADPTMDDGDQITRLLDLFDGIQAKGTEIVCILTTNHPERIHKGMVRPGRLDSVVHIGKLDDAGIEALIRANVAEGLIAPDVDFERICAAMDGFLPSFVREAADRAVRYALDRDDGDDDPVLQTDDFVFAAGGLAPQLELMLGAKDTMERDRLSVVMEDVAANAATRAVRETVAPDYLVPANGH